MKKFNVLHIEDRITDSELIVRELKKNQLDFHYLVVDTEAEYLNALHLFAPDIVLCDHALPTFNSLDALKILKGKGLAIPFILITGVLSDKITNDIMAAGADDYILKDRLGRLPHAVLNALEKYNVDKERKKLLHEVKETEALSHEALSSLSEKLLLATQAAGIGIWEYALPEAVFTGNEELYAQLGISASDFDGSYEACMQLVHPQDRKKLWELFKAALANKNELTTEFRIVWPDGTVRFIKTVATIQRHDSGKPARILATNQDITGAKQAELTFKESEAKYRSFFDNSLHGILLFAADGQINAANPAACAMFQMTEAEICKGGTKAIIAPADPALKQLLKERQQNGKAQGELTFVRKDGSTFPGDVTTAVFNDANDHERTSVIIRDVSKRKESESNLVATSNALQQAVNDLNKIMNSSLDVICSIDGEGRFVNVSSASEHIWGYHPAELLGKKYMDLVLPDDEAATLDTASKIVNGIPVTTFENRYVHKNGNIVPILWSARWDENDKLMYCVAKDITKKKRLEKAFENERKRFEDMFFQAPSSIGILKGPDHVFEMANPLYLEMTGKVDIVGKTVREVFPELSGSGLFEVLDEVYSTGVTFSACGMQVQVQREGTGKLTNLYLNFVYQPYRNEEGEIAGIFFFANDVTEQVEARKKVSQEKANLQTILNTTEVAYSLQNKNLNIVAFNRAANEWFEIRTQQSLQQGTSYLQYISDNPAEITKEKLEAVLAGENFEFEAHMPLHNGEYRWYLIRMHPIIVNEGIDGVCIATEDITREKEARLEREKMTSDLIQRNKDLEQFSYIVSHNLRSHVANISGTCEILKTDIDADTREMFWAEVFNSANKLDSVLKDLNTILYVKKEIKECNEKVKFSVLISDIQDTIVSLLHTAGATIQTDFSEVDIVNSLRSYLYSIFYNLITNSIKYRRPDIDLIIKVQSKNENGKVKLVFSDNGLGIDLEKKRDQIFMLYKRFHNHVEGKGMGLFMTKTQVESLGGTISIESKVNEGTVFTIIL